MKKYQQPLSNRVIIKKTTPDQMSKGGIHFPDTFEDSSPLASGIVIEVGRGMFKEFTKSGSTLIPTFDAPEVKPGDVVLFDKRAGAVITNNDGSKLQIVRETDIYTVERSK